MADGRYKYEYFYNTPWKKIAFENGVSGMFYVSSAITGKRAGDAFDLIARWAWYDVVRSAQVQVQVVLVQVQGQVFTALYITKKLANANDVWIKNFIIYIIICVTPLSFGLLYVSIFQYFSCRSTVPVLRVHYFYRMFVWTNKYCTKWYKTSRRFFHGSKATVNWRTSTKYCTPRYCRICFRRATKQYL